jgi:hypothetical protein
MDLEFENIVLIVTFLVLISLVYVTGFIVWVCCRRSERSTVRPERKRCRSNPAMA